MILVAQASANESPQPTGDVVFDGGFAYWPEIGPEVVAANNTGSGETEPAKTRIVATIIQLNLATGERRTLFSTGSHYKTFLGSVVANAGRIAFTARTYSRSSKKPRIKRDLTKAYSMAIGDPLPTLLEEQAMVYRGVNVWKRHKGKRYKEFKVKSYCGEEVETRDISELGITLVARTTISCKRLTKKKASSSNRNEKYKAFGYAPGSASAIAYGTAPYGPLLLRSNELFGAGENETVAARDVSSNAIRSYATGGYPIDIDVSSDRRVAAVSLHWAGKNKAPAQILTIFPPAATEPVVTVPLLNEVIATTFCTDSVLQVSAAASAANSRPDVTKGPLLLTLRDFNGAVLNEITLPANGQLLGSGCSGRTAQLATRGSLGVVVTSYPL